MPYGEHRVKCSLCFRYFTCGDCIPLVCPDCERAGKKLSPPTAIPPPPASGTSDHQARYRRAAALLGRWQNETGDYDERVWPLLQSILNEKTDSPPDSGSDGAESYRVLGYVPSTLDLWAIAHHDNTLVLDNITGKANAEAACRAINTAFHAGRASRDAGGLGEVLDFLTRLKRWRDQQWDSLGDRPSSPPAVLLGIESALASAAKIAGGAPND